MARLRDSRQKFMSRFRSISTAPESSSPSVGSDLRSAVQDVMMEEWEGLRREVWGGAVEGGYLDHVLGVMDELREELIREGMYRAVSVCVCVCVHVCMHAWVGGRLGEGHNMPNSCMVAYTFNCTHSFYF